MGLLNKLFRKNKDNFSSYTYQEEFSEEKWQAAVNAANEKFDRTFHLNSEESILSIPVVKLFKIDETFNGVTSCYNILNKKATAFKKEQRMDLAIACLRKVNQYMEMSGRNYLADDYLRLVEFLKQDRQFEAARQEENIIKSRFPELFEIIHNERFDETLNLAKQFGDCFIIFYTTDYCPHCSPYNNRLFSVDFNNKLFPHIITIPDFLKQNKCPVCGKYISCHIMFKDKLYEYPDIMKINVTPISDTRTPEQKEYFEQEQLSQQRAKMTKFEYDWLWENMPEVCPKSLSGYSKMKNSNSANFQKIVAAAKEKGFDIITL